MKKAYIIEDHTSAQQWLREALESAYPGIDIHFAATLQDAHALLEQGAPDIALVDLNLPDGSGTEFIERLNRESPSTAAIVTTIYDDDSYLFPALRAGAKGYILKEQRKEEISRLLKGIVNGQPPLSPAISQRMLNYFSSPAGAPPQNEADATLSNREREVLSIISRGHSLNETAKVLGVSRNTVATQVKSIYNKLNISSRAEAAIAASKLGILGR
jgi:DNA-binding NarL/FixJ family response regulator